MIFSFSGFYFLLSFLAADTKGNFGNFCNFYTANPHVMLTWARCLATRGIVQTHGWKMVRVFVNHVDTFTGRVLSKVSGENRES